jgi:hypothetical protein
VQIARDPRPLDFLRCDQPAGQILNLSTTCLQDGFVPAHRLFGALPFTDIHVRPDQVQRRAVRTSDQGAPLEEPPETAILVQHPMGDFVGIGLAADAALSYRDAVYWVSFRLEMRCGDRGGEVNDKASRR